ncbi:hypothetical protein CEXT_567021 [Caerostris extrusa]|uniref:Uncharacterized protein n=1 Tax=Caerostris extrusa TaxID=172846 RepID=A0AAV4RKH1_CAEEX|nr:hypothetical protein CEXT_567021 [Caerostris extrusa]
MPVIKFADDFFFFFQMLDRKQAERKQNNNWPISERLATENEVFARLRLPRSFAGTYQISLKLLSGSSKVLDPCQSQPCEES